MIQRQSRYHMPQRLTYTIKAKDVACTARAQGAAPGRLRQNAPDSAGDGAVAAAEFAPASDAAHPDYERVARGEARYLGSLL